MTPSYLHLRSRRRGATRCCLVYPAMVSRNRLALPGAHSRAPDGPDATPALPGPAERGAVSPPAWGYRASPARATVRESFGCVARVSVRLARLLECRVRRLRR